jgi:hypothetical protein
MFFRSIIMPRTRYKINHKQSRQFNQVDKQIILQTNETEINTPLFSHLRVLRALRGAISPKNLHFPKNMLSLIMRRNTPASQAEFPGQKSPPSLASSRKSDAHSKKGQKFPHAVLEFPKKHPSFPKTKVLANALSPQSPKPKVQSPKSPLQNGQNVFFPLSRPKSHLSPPKNFPHPPPKWSFSTIYCLLSTPEKRKPGTSTYLTVPLPLVTPYLIPFHFPIPTSFRFITLPPNTIQINHKRFHQTNQADNKSNLQSKQTKINNSFFSCLRVLCVLRGAPLLRRLS